jgi:hypothetical protein
VGAARVGAAGAPSKKEMIMAKYGHRPLTKSECAQLTMAKGRLGAVAKILDGLPVEPARGRTLYADIEALEFRLSEVKRQLCKRR